MVGYSGLVATPDDRYIIYVHDGVGNQKGANFLRFVLRFLDVSSTAFL